MYTLTISDTVDMPGRRRQIAVTRAYETSEEAAETDVQAFYGEALEIASSRFLVVDETYLDKPDVTDPDNKVRVWLFGGARIAPNV